MNDQADILALLRIIRDQQAHIDTLTAKVNEATEAKERYFKWWTTDLEELNALKATQAGKEADRA